MRIKRGRYKTEHLEQRKRQCSQQTDPTCHAHVNNKLLCQSRIYKLRRHPFHIAATPRYYIVQKIIGYKILPTWSQNNKEKRLLKYKSQYAAYCRYRYNLYEHTPQHVKVLPKG